MWVLAKVHKKASVRERVQQSTVQGRGQYSMRREGRNSSGWCKPRLAKPSNQFKSTARPLTGVTNQFCLFPFPFTSLRLSYPHFVPTHGVTYSRISNTWQLICKIAFSSSIRYDK